MTHKPDTDKDSHPFAGGRWKFATSIKQMPVVLLIFIGFILPASNLCGQNIAVKSNLLYDLTSSFNLGGEIRCDDTHTLSPGN